MDEKPEPKISTVEVIIVGLMLLIADVVEIIIVLVGLDDFWISDAIAFPATWLYLTIKGVKGEYAIVLQAIEFIPYVGWLPLRTIGWIITVWVDRHPKLEAVVQKVPSLAAKRGLQAQTMQQRRMAASAARKAA